jgi:hypothetical protein
MQIFLVFLTPAGVPTHTLTALPCATMTWRRYSDGVTVLFPVHSASLQISETIRGRWTAHMMFLVQGLAKDEVCPKYGGFVPPCTFYSPDACLSILAVHQFSRMGSKAGRSHVVRFYGM